MTRFLSTIIVLLACALPGGVRAVPVLPDFGAATFVAGAPIDNPYFPLLDRSTRVFVSLEEGEDNRFEHQVIGPGRILLGVQTTALRDRAFEDGLLVEDTFDYFAQDSAGNVWYFGEDVTNYHYDDDGVLIGTDTSSSWLAGLNLADPGGDPAQPGFIMPAVRPIGFEYFQEFAVDDEALDEGQIFAIVPLVESGIGQHADALQVLETSQLDPDAREFKYYAPGIGLVRAEEGLDGNLLNPEETFVLARVIAVPEPSAALLLIAGLGLLLPVYRRLRR